MAQPDLVAMQGSLMTLANNIPLLPNVVPNQNTTLQQQITQLQHDLGQQIADMQHQLQQQIQQLQQQTQQSQLDILGMFDLLPMKFYNSTASAQAPLQYPPGIPITAILPRTKADVESFIAHQLQTAAVVLGLPPLVPQQPTVLARRNQLKAYLGIPFM